MIMSIDVRVTEVVVHQNGGGELHLKDRPAPQVRSGSKPGTAVVHQQVLFFDKAPPDVYALEGKDLQLGTQPSEDVTLDGRKIAVRRGYAGVEFVVDRIEEG
jgi:hypothetical protein